MSKPFDKHEQPKLLPDRRPIIQRAERPPLQHSQSKTRVKISVPENSITKSSKHHDKVSTVSDYTITQTMSECDSISGTIRKDMQDTRKKIPSYADPIYRPSLKPTKIPLQVIPRKITDIDILEHDINMDLEENSPHQEGVISEIYQRPDKSHSQEPPELQGLVSTGKPVQKSLPKQADIDKILKIIQRKVLKETYLPLTVKGIQAGYLISIYFKDLHLYLAQSKFPNTKSAIQKVETLEEKILLDSLLFKLVTTSENETALLVIPETSANNIIMLYHSSVLTGHQGVIKTYLTIGDKFLYQV